MVTFPRRKGTLNAAELAILESYAECIYGYPLARLLGFDPLATGAPTFLELKRLIGAEGRFLRAIHAPRD